MCRLGQIHVYYSNKAHRAGFYVPGADEAVSGISVSFPRLQRLSGMPLGLK